VTEKEIQNAIRVALGSEPDLLLMRNNTGYAKLEKVVYGLGKGGADLVGVLKLETLPGRAKDGGPRFVGRFFALEVKRPGKSLEPDQVRWLNLIRSFGGFGAGVHSVDEARAALKRAREGQDQ
jgi:hypothetical protein